MKFACFVYYAFLGALRYLNKACLFFICAKYFNKKKNFLITSISILLVISLTLSLSVFYYHFHDFYYFHFYFHFNSYYIFYYNLYENKLKYELYHLTQIFYHQNMIKIFYQFHKFLFYIFQLVFFFLCLIIFLLKRVFLNSLNSVAMLTPLAVLDSLPFTFLMSTSLTLI